MEPPPPPKNSLLTENSSILSIWPESERLQIAMNSLEGAKMRYTLPAVKYDFAVAFNDGNNISMNEEGIMAFVRNGSFREALYLTTKLLNNMGHGIGVATGPSQQFTPLSLRIWSLRFHLMMVFRYYSQLLDELMPFGDLDAPDLYFQFHNTESKGSMVPFNLRLVHAEVASFSPCPYQSIVRIQKLLKDAQTVIEIVQKESPNSPELAIWNSRIEVVKDLRARIFFRLKEYDKSFSAYEQIVNGVNVLAEKRKNILEAMLRMAMHIGDEKRVEKYLTELGNLCGNDNESAAIHSFSKSIFDGDYAQGLALLEESIKQNPRISSDPKFCNNQAICLLYNGRALECLQMLFNHPGPVNEPLALNLSTISDLISTNSQTLKQNYLAAKNSQDKRNDVFDPQVMRIG